MSSQDVRLDDVFAPGSRHLAAQSQPAPKLADRDPAIVSWLRRGQTVVHACCEAIGLVVLLGVRRHRADGCPSLAPDRFTQPNASSRFEAIHSPACDRIGTTAKWDRVSRSSVYRA